MWGIWALVAIKLTLGVLPVTLFLLSLIYLDSYKLVHLRSILLTIAAGSLAALASYWINLGLVQWGVLTVQNLPRYGAPVVEESLKAALVLFLLSSGRIGFLVDAAIYGFAVGTGFALLENVYYLSALSHSPMVLWMVRGFGTAIMHGGTTGIFSLVARSVWKREALRRGAGLLAGIAAAVLMHSLFNHFFLSPLLSTVLVLLAFPPLVLAVFSQSERFLRQWLGTGFDMDSELVRLIESSHFSDSRIGRYLQSLRARFEGEVVVDMLCYLRLHVELSLRAKGMLMMRESGFPLRKDPEIEAKMAELHYLEKSIGKTGQLAMRPFLHTSVQDLWQLQYVEESVGTKGGFFSH